jgi:hypothetical protein
MCEIHIRRIISIALRHNYHNSGLVHRLAFYRKHDVSESGFCLRLQADPIQMDPVDRGSLCLRTMDNVQNCDSYINIPSSQTYR